MGTPAGESLVGNGDACWGMGMPVEQLTGLSILEDTAMPDLHLLWVLPDVDWKSEPMVSL